MGNTLMSLLVKLGLDSTALYQGLAKAESSSINSMATIGKGMVKAGSVMTVGLTLPLVAAGLKAVSAASNMAESMSKVNVVFGESAKQISAWSETSAKALGMSQQQALEAAGTYGNLFQAMGLTRSNAVEMSTSVVQLAADLASFNNANPEETLLALRSGLSGEMEPLKKYGVALTEATLSQMAMKMGLGDNIQVLTEAEKMQVRYAVIMAQTASAQGDFERTADGLANSTRILKAELSNVAVEMGERLLPIGIKVVSWALDLLKKFEAFSPGKQKIILVMAGIVALSGPVITGIGGILGVTSSLMKILPIVNTALGTFGIELGVILLPITMVVGGIGLIVYAISQINKNKEIQEAAEALDAMRATVHDTSGSTESLASSIDNIQINAIRSFAAAGNTAGGLGKDLDDVAEKAEALRNLIVDRTSWESMYTAAKDATEKTAISLDLLGGMVQGLGSAGALVWEGFLFATGKISPAAIEQFVKILAIYEEVKRNLAAGIAIPLIIQNMTTELSGLNAVAATTSGDWSHAGWGVGGAAAGHEVFVNAITGQYSTSGTSFQQVPPGYSLGGSFEVPPGYQNDSFPLRVESGEVVRITPAGTTAESDAAGDTYNITINNPVPEPSSKSIETTMRKMSYLGAPE